MTRWRTQSEGDADALRRGQPGAARLGKPTHLLAGVAAIWSVVLLILAVVLPIESSESSDSMYSIVHFDGYRVLGLVAIPLAVTVVVWLLLHVRSGPRAGRVALILAWVLSSAVVIAALLGTVTFLVGIFLLPTGAGLVGATASVPGTAFGRD